jgi:chromosome segregation ATPase
MKKLLFVLAILCYAFNSQAATIFKADTVTKDTAKINKKIKDMNTDMLNLKAQKTDVQGKIPVDSVKLVNLTETAHDAQVKSKNAANSAVGGDLSVSEKSEKLAKKATNITDDQHDAEKQLDNDRKKLKNLDKEIEKTQKKLDKLQTP